MTTRVPHTYAATVQAVIDGDTYDVAIDLGFRIAFRTRLRLLHVDAPEHGTPEGDAATARVRELLPLGGPVTVETAKPDKYGRALARVTLSDGSDLAGLLVTEGHARPYEGGKR